MGTRGGDGHDAGVVRLLIFWTRPQHLSAAEADAWARRELSPIAQLAAVERADLISLHPTSERLDCRHDWLLDVRLAAGAQPADCVESPPCADWIADMRLLGMSPSVVVAGGGESLAGSG